MAITIDWATKIINVPKADLTLIQASPVEIRELNLNWFRLTLKDIEDSEEGMPYLDTHRHNTEVTVSGITLARVVEIINGYTVTFEDGQYAVNLVGANSNVGDVVNVNQVSVRSGNSAGLISSQDIEYASYQNCVTVDTTSPFFGTIHPVGTKRQPVNNLTDALLIADYRGLTRLEIIGNATINSAGDFSGMTIVGEGITKSIIVVETGANVYKCTFADCHLQGILDGEATATNCCISDLNYVNGVLQECVLEEGTIQLAGGAAAMLLDCWSGGAKAAAPIIDLGGAGQELVVRNYSGSIRLRNKTGTEPVSITMDAGQVRLENTITNGLIRVSGVGSVDDGSQEPAEVDTSDLFNAEAVATEIFQAVDIETGLNFLDSMRLVLAAAAGRLAGAEPGSTTITIRNAGDGTKNRIVATVDQYGNRSTLTFDLT